VRPPRVLVHQVDAPDRFHILPNTGSPYSHGPEFAPPCRRGKLRVWRAQQSIGFVPISVHLLSVAEINIGRLPVEYLHLPAPRTQYVSEYGHLLRIASVYGCLEAALNSADSMSILVTYVLFSTLAPYSHSPPYST
jgi:hypothetical protein